LTQSTSQFEQVFRKFRPGLISFARSIIHNEQDAEEVVHDVFMAYWYAGNVRDIEETGLKSYLFTSVRNRSLNCLRKKRFDMTDLPEDSSAFKEVDNSVLENIEAKQVQERITILIEHLPKKCRQIFLMSRVYELSHKEIAELMDITPKTVENQIGLALKFLKLHIQR
jgi:RNA polymerase sigma-70 factor (ECF subfamily)